MQKITFEQAGKILKDVYREMTSKANYFGYARYHLRGLKMMVELGWFVWPTAPGAMGKTLWEAHTVDGFSLDAISDWIAQQVEADSEHIFSAAFEMWPERMRFLESAKRRFLEEDWAAFLPLALAQADGMSKQVFADKSQLFHDASFKKRRAAQRKWRKANFPQLQALFYSIQYGEKTKWHQPFQGATRHDVLHGLSLDYDTKRNSLQVLALLGYMSLLQSFKKEVRAERSQNRRRAEPPVLV
jgi:hypothetical protein